MSVELPVSFRLDSQGTLAETLQKDAPSVLVELESQFLPRPCGKVIKAAADLLVTNPANLSESFRHGAFTAAGVVACEAFMRSDAPDDLRNRTIKSLSIASMPLQLLSHDPGETLESFQSVAVEGHASHPELKHHTDVVMKYYTEVTQQADIGRVAFCGAGFVIHQLNLAWQRSRESLIEEICTDEAGDIDWDNLQWHP